MVLAILLGICAGVIGFMPLLVGLKLTKRSTHAGLSGSMFLLIVGLVVSFVLLFVFAILCVNIDRPNAMPFVLAEVVALCVTAIGYGVRSVLKK